MITLGRKKYNNQKCMGYASKREAQRASELKLLERAGKISGLKEQVRFELIPKQIDELGHLLERECSYIADFCYIDLATGKNVVEDAKGYKTPEYIIKRKLMLFMHGIRIKEV